MIRNKFFFLKWTFSTQIKKINSVEIKKFIFEQKKPQKQLFIKYFLTGGMAYNVIFFCLKNRELANIANYIKPVVFTVNNLIIESTSFNSNNSWFFFKFKFKKSLYKKLFFLKFKKSLLKNTNFLYKNFLIFWNFILKKTTKQNFKPHLNKKPTILSINNKIEDDKKSEKPPVLGYLFIWSTWNNFFVTITDNRGNTLVNRTGGNSERTGTWQRATVFSADNAIYEACYLAREKGIETLSVHIRSTIRLPQIKNCFEGLETSGLIIDEIIYRPIQSFGGCRLKKPRRV